MAKTKKLVAFVLVFAMLLTTGVLSFAQETDKSLMQETVYDFTKDEYDTDSLSWLSQNLARHDENGLTNYDSWFAFGPMKKFGKAGYGYEAWVEASVMDRDAYGAINNALCFGVRNDNMADIFLQKGLWFFIRSNGVSVSLGNGDGSYFDRSAIRLANCPVSFAESTKITIKDEIDKISLLAGSTLLLTCEIADSTITVKDGAGNAVGTINDANLPDTGYVRVMPHYTDATIARFGYSTVSDEVMAENYVPANKLNQRDVYADTWVAADNLNRKVENYDGTNPPRDKKVGMFYLTWHMPEHAPYYDKANMYDTYQAYKDGGVDGVYKQLQEGPLGFGHYWARPYLGYYQSTDDWVIRKHAQQLSNAGIDFLYLDASNGVSYIGAYDKIFKIFKEIREEGGKTPQIVFFTAVDPTNSAKVVNEVYEEYYKPGQYTDLWFMWEGKPVIFSCNDDFVGISDEIKNFFTFRRCWAFDEQWFTKVNGVNSWPWIMDYPQKPGITADGKVEQVVASCGFHATGLPIAHGRSYAGGVQPGTDKEDFGFSLMESTTPLGLAFDEQWSRVVELDPPIAMITGWNEWWAGRWDNQGAGGTNYAEGQVQCNTYVITAGDEVKRNYFVDCFNPEYSRDFEAMTGGFGDNYYWQLVKNVREWRGARPLPASNGRYTIDINDGFYQWIPVGPEFRDNIYDTTHRNYPAFVGNDVYVNETGRNDIAAAKVARDDEFVYFYVETREDIIWADGYNCMNLFIDADGDHETGWEGYDYLINRQRDAKELSIETNQGNQWSWTNTAVAEYRSEGNKLMVKIKQSDLNLDFSKGFEFKWADNSVASGVVMEFMDLGDAAPDERFNFRYTEEEVPFTLADDIKAKAAGKVILQLNKNVAFTNGERTYVDPANASVKPILMDGKTMMPVRYIIEALGGTVEYDFDTKKITANVNGNTIEMTIDENRMTVNGAVKEIEAPARIVNDRTMLPLRDFVESLGKVVTWNEWGLVIIGDEEVTDQSFIDTMLLTL